MPVLPVAAYTSQAWYDLEQARIFSRSWACAGFVEEITEPGHYLAVQAGLYGICIVIGEDRVDRLPEDPDARSARRRRQLEDHR
ncbi:MAG: hypothetical protein OXF86_13405 [Caldilineaceae bacterium]|nr:hypothetical protein [Caldilineaceae bacterium]